MSTTAQESPRTTAFAARPGVWLRIAVGIAIAIAGSGARADGLADEAELHFQIGTDQYRRGEFTGALEHFLLSNRLVPNKNVVFNIARTYEQLKRFADAHRYYVDALAVEDSPQVRVDINAAIQRITPNVAVLVVETTPPGATIYIDRKDLGSRGRSPRPLALPEGRYRVIAELDGYEASASEPVEARLGAELKVPLVLTRIVGKIRIAVANPKLGIKAVVRMDDERGPVACEAPCEIEAPPGRHMLYFSHEGYQAAPRPVDVIARTEVVVTADLRALTGSLVVSSDERDALVEIDGRPMGFTPAVIQNVAVGRRRVRISLRDHRPIEREVEIKADEQATLSDLRMIPLRQVDAASRYAESIDDAPSSVTIISREEIQAFGYPTIAEALRGVRGVYLSNDRVYYSAGIRGLGEPNDYGNRVLVLSDGQSLNDNILNSSYIGSDARADLKDLDRIEVVRGPGSLLYGTGAFSGVINLVPHGRDEPDNVHISAGTYDNGVVRGRAGFHKSFSPNAGISASASFARGDGVDVPITLVEPIDGSTVKIANNVDRFRSGGTYGRLYAGAFTAQWFFHSREQFIPIGVFASRFNDPRTEYTDTRMMAEVRYEPRLSEKVELMTRVHANRYVYHGELAYEAPPGPANVEDYYGTWFGGEARVIITPLRAVRITAGAEAQIHPQATMEGGFPEPYINVHHPYNFGAGYALIDVSPTPRLRFSGGARIDAYSTIGPTVVPRLTAIVKTSSGGVLKVMGGRAFRAPSIYEQYYTDGNKQLTSTDPRRGLMLGPEYVYSGEVEYSQRFLTDWVALAATHANYIQGIINTVPDEQNEGAIHYANSTAPGLAIGAEVELRRDFRQGIMLAITYGYEHARYLGGIDPNPRLLNAPEHLASIRGVVPVVTELCSVGARATLEAPRRISITGDDMTPTAVVADLVLSGAVKRFGLSYVLGLYNITDMRYVYPVTETYLSKTVPQNGRTFLADLTFTYP